jgi:putative nucleotidyltransferase with HDIG domain
MTDLNITRQEALNLLKTHIKKENTIKHSLATEAVMHALAKKLGEDENLWAMAGLLHDLDSELINADMKVHGLKTAEILKEKGLPDELVEAVKMHNEHASGQKRTDKFHKALASGETITGLIIATTLVYPDKKLASVKPKSVIKRMKDARFAASVNRDIIKECEDIGVPLAEFVELSLNAMREISDELGL